MLTTEADARTFLRSLPPSFQIASELLPTISVAAHARIDVAIQNAWARSTMEKYVNNLAHFHAFCDTESIPHHLRLPASEFLLCAFAASFAGTHAGSTVENKLSAVRAWHILNNRRYNGGLRLNYVLKGVENLAPDSLPPRPPVTLEMIRFLAENLDFTNPFDCCVFAAAVVAFWGQCRLGELLSATERSFDPEVTPVVSHVGPSCTRGGSRTLHLPNTKTRGKKGDDVFLSRQRGAADPVDALNAHIAANHLLPGDPLFSYRARSGGILALTKRKFLARCNEVWSKFGLPRLTGHCFRIGGTTELLLAGVPPDIVKLMGRWSSDAFLRYWRALHRIAPPYVEFLGSQA
ncbi:DNA breaking-rejoining enzyme [Mycena metata]|uniref:DNA breaking-rejoining enzyme n=1 Tax=Mycena metata TaxID=1033252 RepID=A0AAD7JE62_9AGAR|nr:DNA breaking-rejoining enzyme [Mycena metata]